MGGQPLTGRLRKQMAYVLQEDIMYASLTLQETLYVSKGGRLGEVKVPLARVLTHTANPWPIAPVEPITPRLHCRKMFSNGNANTKYF